MPSILPWVLSLVVALLPITTVAEMLVIVLRRLSKHTGNTLDDELVDVLVRKFGIPQEESNESERNI